MWNVIKDGMEAKELWHKVKIGLVLQDEQSREHCKSWGEVYASDQYIYDQI